LGNAGQAPEKASFPLAGKWLESGWKTAGKRLENGLPFLQGS
jgi:hypothetical protein